MDETHLARRFSEGGEDAFTTLYTTYRGPAFGIALHVLADPGLAEEAIQMAFLGVWRSRERYDPDRSLAAWVFGITRKAAIDIYRRERRLPATVDTDAEPAVEALSVERMWEAWEVRRAVDALPAEEAVVVRLAHYYQMTHSEIAAHLGLPVGTVKSRSFRAHRRLARAMRHLFEGEPGPAGTEPTPTDEVPAGG